MPKSAVLSLKEIARNYFLPALLGIALLVSLFHPAANNITATANRLQRQLAEGENVFTRMAVNKAVFRALASGDLTADILKPFAEAHVWLYYYRNDSLLTWTNNQVVPPVAASSLPEGTSLLQLKNGWYEVLLARGRNEHEKLVGLVPVKNNYPFENRFLKNDFDARFQVPDNIELSDEKIPGAIPVKNNHGDFLFSLYVSGTGTGDAVNVPLLVSELLLWLLIFYYLSRFTALVKQRFGFIRSWVFLGLGMLLIRAMMLWLNLPDEVHKLDLFNPKNYASSIVTQSLGDLVLNIALLVWLVFYYLRHRPEPRPDRLHLLRALALTAGVFLFSGLVSWVFKTLVMDSVISFEIYNILSLDGYSFLGFVSFAMLLVTHFVFVREVINRLVSAKISLSAVAVLAGACAILFSLLAVGSPFYHIILFTAGWTFVLILFLWQMMRSEQNLSVRNLLLYLAVYSIIATFLIENLYERKERNQRIFFASKLGSERDYVAEYMFNDIAKRIAQDGFVRSFLTNPLISQRQVSDRLNALYLSGYFNKYDLKIFAFDSRGQSIKAEDSLASRQMEKFMHEKDAPALHYVPDTAQNYAYISAIHFAEDSMDYGYVVMKLTPKVYYGQNVYPELLVGSNVTLFNNVNNYEYAIYQNDRLVAQYGDYPYTYQWNKEYHFGNEEHVFVEEPQWEHGIMRFPNGKKVVVSVAREPLFEPVATFSYLYAFFFSVVVIVWLVVSLVRYQGPPENELLQHFSLSFRTRINYSMLAMIVFSFIIIGVITINFFRAQYNHFYSDRLLRKEKVVHASLEYFIQQYTNPSSGGPLWSANLDVEVARLAEINTVDINLFDDQGRLVEASQPAIYDKGIISKNMNPSAYFRLLHSKAARTTVQEHIGGLKYLAAYSPLRNRLGVTVGFLGIPYFERSRDINDEVSGFLVALMNVYVFLLICAAVLAYFISNSITRPLTIISDKLRILNLNKKNEPIEWNSRDEIGVLIGEYNKMIAELEKSAHKLAKSERESAWREMAKQIAHEIKNPLTPMKLSIQYLQKAIDAGQPNIDQLAKKVTATLEEQIENLSSIATAFSSFAKMPRPENELINLNDLLKSISELFNKEEGVHVTFTTDCESPLVFADKNQLVSVFNNLVKNAIQSIPENRTGFIDVNVKEADGLVLVAVSDNGCGIPQENYDSVFVPNFTTKSSGTGLGLAISKRIIDGAGGKIWFESAENVGTTFYVRLKKEQ